MENIITYIEEYGKDTFRQRPFCPVDSLVLAELSYLKYDHCASHVEKSQNHITLSEIAGHGKREIEYLLHGMMDYENNLKLLQLAGKSRRFGGTEIAYYEDLVEEEKETQFAAMVFLLEGCIPFMAFRGTDETLTGWKEDFNMTYMSPVPAQERALEYLKRVAPVLIRNRSGGFYMGGHSKGGNLAVYAAWHASRTTENSIRQVYNLDGPGFGSGLLEDVNYQYVEKKIMKFIPQSSVIGLLMENQDTYQIIRSAQEGILQHDPFSWVVKQGAFVYLESLDDKAQIMGKTLYQWIEDMSEDERQRLVELIFKVLSDEQITPLAVFTEDWKEHVGIALNMMKELDEDTRNFVWEVFLQFIKIGTRNMIEHNTDTEKN